MRHTECTSDVGAGELADPLTATAARRPGLVAVGDHHDLDDRTLAPSTIAAIAPASAHEPSG